MQISSTLTRWLFISFSILIISLILWNTYSFFNQLKDNERTKMQIWAAAQAEFQEIDLSANGGNMILDVLQTNTTTPMILYSHKEDTYDSKNISNLDVKNKSKRERLIDQFISEYKPIEVIYKEELLQTIYYGNSPIINKIKYYPAFLILILFLFITAIYFFNKTAKSGEQNKLWAGMAKETAHQIGTPLSSLVGWAEILKTENVNPEYVVEIEKDITRLETITERFSKIGSIPKLERTDLVAETQAAFDYLKSRSSKLINFELRVPEDPIYVDLNPQLFGWTIENLVKNGIDAMKGKGDISIAIEKTTKNAMVCVTDSGKGIAKKNFNKVFSPGFTSKKRGWGLGLSLAKRIINEYHKGKIRVLRSTLGKGTVMEISLKLIE